MMMMMMTCPTTVRRLEVSSRLTVWRKRTHVGHKFLVHSEEEYTGIYRTELTTYSMSAAAIQSWYQAAQESVNQQTQLEHSK